MKFATLVAAAGIAAVAAQDPAPGWLGYARALNPSGQGRMTYIQARWKVGALPRDSSSFYSPWFGVDTSDNLNLYQPVNPWFGSAPWQIYNEYFQWSPEYNYNSASHNVQPGDILFGSVSYDAASETYVIYHKDETDGWEVSTPIKAQKGSNGQYKNVSIAYFVYEKVAPCRDYPPDGQVTFYDIVIQFDGVNVTNPVWSTGYVEDVCNMRAHIVDNSTVSITWNTAAEDPAPELIATSQATGLGGRAPRQALPGFSPASAAETKAGHKAHNGKAHPKAQAQELTAEEEKLIAH